MTEIVPQYHGNQKIFTTALALALYCRFLSITVSSEIYSLHSSFSERELETDLGAVFQPLLWVLGRSMMEQSMLWIVRFS